MIGWQQSTTQYASHDASGDSDSNEVVCEHQTSSFTTLVYRVDSGKSSFVYISLTSIFNICIPYSFPAYSPPNNMYSMLCGSMQVYSCKCVYVCMCV